MNPMGTFSLLRKIMWDKKGKQIQTKNSNHIPGKRSITATLRVDE